MKKLLFFLTCVSFNSFVSAQNFEKINKKLEDTWVGTIVFNDDTEFTGKFTYNPLNVDGILLVKTDSTRNAYGVNVVKSFLFYDDEAQTRRYFYSLPVYHHITRKYFFELFHHGSEISILSRNTIKVKDSYVKVKKYVMTYLLDHRDNTIHNLSREQVLRMTDDKKLEVNADIKEKKIFLSYKKTEDYIAVVDYYNSLKTNP